MLHGDRSLGSPLSHLPPPPSDGSRACRCLWLRPATAATLRPLQGAGRGRGEGEGGVSRWAGSARSLAHPDPGAERHRRGAGNTVGGRLSVRVWWADPGEGETPGLIAPACAGRSATARSAAGCSLSSAARWPERARAYPAWRVARRGGEPGGAGKGCARLESVGAPGGARPRLAPNLGQGCGVSTLPPSSVPQSSLGLPLPDSPRHSLRQGTRTDGAMSVIPGES